MGGFPHYNGFLFTRAVDFSCFTNAYTNSFILYQVGVSDVYKTF